MTNFGDIKLTNVQLNKMGKTLWDDCGDDTHYKWKDFTAADKQSFIGEFILTIPKVLAAIGLKAVKK